MSERLFLFIVGCVILTALYMEIDMMIYSLCLWLFFEAITNLRITVLSQKLTGKMVPAGLTVFQTSARFYFDAFRAWRIMVPTLLGGALLLINEQQIEILWFFPWFMGFAIIGAGVSGICPMLLLIRWVGFR